MKSIPLPIVKIKSVISACSGAISDKKLADKLLQNEPCLTAREEEYILKGMEGLLFTLDRSSNCGELTSSDMIKVYTGTLSRKGSNARSIYYDFIKSRAPYGICPSCFQRTVSTLDHYLPKSLYSIHSITPANLVPSCSDCNKSKSSKRAATASEQFLHPYFDNFDQETWLKADVIKNDPPGLIFFVEPPSDWSSAKADRVHTHFNNLQLAKLYASHGGRLISDIGNRLNKLCDVAGPDAVREHLRAEAETRLLRAKNSWQIASYLALSQSEFFCSFRHT